MCRVEGCALFGPWGTGYVFLCFTAPGGDVTQSLHSRFSVVMLALPEKRRKWLPFGPRQDVPWRVQCSLWLVRGDLFSPLFVHLCIDWCPARREIAPGLASFVCFPCWPCHAEGGGGRLAYPAACGGEADPCSKRLSSLPISRLRERLALCFVSQALSIFFLCFAVVSRFR